MPAGFYLFIQFLRTKEISSFLIKKEGNNFWAQFEQFGRCCILNETLLRKNRLNLLRLDFKYFILLQVNY